MATGCWRVLAFGDFLKLLEEDNAEDVEWHFSRQGGSSPSEQALGALQPCGHADGFQHVTVPPDLQALLDDLARYADAGAQEGADPRRKALHLSTRTRNSMQSLLCNVVLTWKRKCRGHHQHSISSLVEASCLSQTERPKIIVEPQQLF